MDQTYPKEYAKGSSLTATDKIAVSKGQLESLQSLQRSALGLITQLGEKLEPVLEPAPAAEASALDSWPHINSAVSTQVTINNRLEYLLNDLVL